MDWSNFLSAIVGAVIGAVGAVIAALITIDRARKQEQERARRERTLEVSGRLADLLIQMYDELTILTLSGGSPDDAVSVSALRPMATTLRRMITVDSPFLGHALGQKMKNVRQELKRVIGRQGETATRSDVLLLLGTVRAAGDLLKKLRREGYEDIGPGASLGEPSNS